MRLILLPRLILMMTMRTCRARRRLTPSVPAPGVWQGLLLGVRARDWGVGGMGGGRLVCDKMVATVRSPARMEASQAASKAREALARTRLFTVSPR